MKKFILFFVFALSVIVVKAQEGYNYKEFAIGLDLGYERGYTNVQKQFNHVSENINFTYNYSPYIPVTAELQFGTLSGGGITPLLAPYGVTAARFFMNGITSTTSGVDIVGAYRIPTEHYGRFNLSLAWNNNNTVINKLPTDNALATVSPAPAPSLTFPSSSDRCG